MKELRGINELVEMIKAKVDATPDNLAEELEELEVSFEIRINKGQNILSTMKIQCLLH